jgi:hypothetical protein
VEKRNADVNRSIVHGIKIEDWGFHSNGSGQTNFEAGAAEVFNEARKIVGTVQREPFDGLTRFSRERGEGAPFVCNQAGINICLLRVSGERSAE